MTINKLAIIGGSGLYDVEEFKKRELLDLNTPWGKPSDQILKTNYNDKEVYFTFTNYNSPSIIYSLDPKNNNTQIYWKPDINFDQEKFTRFNHFMRKFLQI